MCPVDRSAVLSQQEILAVVQQDGETIPGKSDSQFIISDGLKRKHRLSWHETINAPH